MSRADRLEALIAILGALVPVIRQVADSIGAEVLGFRGWDGEARQHFDAAVGDSADHLHDLADQLQAMRWRAADDLEREQVRLLAAS